VYTGMASDLNPLMPFCAMSRPIPRAFWVKPGVGAARQRCWRTRRSAHGCPQSRGWGWSRRSWRRWWQKSPGGGVGGVEVVWLAAVRSSMSGWVRQNQQRMWSKLWFSITTTTAVLTVEWISCFRRRHFSQRRCASRQLERTIASRRSATRRPRPPTCTRRSRCLLGRPQPHALSPLGRPSRVWLGRAI
jgi:hypothetical protein